MDVLSRIPGFFHLYSGNSYNDLLQVRGVPLGENTQVAVRLNGHRINNVDEDSSLEWPITLDNVERIEIIVGPGSVLYGPDTLLATINLITREMDGVEVDATYGVGSLANRDRPQGKSNTNQYETTLMGGQKWSETRKIFASGTYAQRKGYWAYQNQSVNGQGVPLPNPGLLLDTLAPSEFLFGNAQFDNWYFQASSLNQDMTRDQYLIGRKNQVNSFLMRYSKDYDEKLSSFVEGSYDNKRLIRTGGWRFDDTLQLYKAEYGLQYKTEKNFFQTGVQGEYDQPGPDYLLTGYPPAKPGSTCAAEKSVEDDNYYILGGYVSDKFSFNDKLSVVGAARGDWCSIVETNRLDIAPRFAIIYHPIERWVLKGMFNSAYKYPEPLAGPEAIWRNRARGYKSGAYWGAADKPEYEYTYELQSIHYIGKSRLSGNIFYQKIENLVGWSSSWTNVADFKGLGAEMDFRCPVNDWFGFWANASYEDTSVHVRDTLFKGIAYATPDGAMNQVPPFMFNAGTDFQLTKNLSFTTSLRYFTELPYIKIMNYTDHGGYWEKWDKVRNVYYVDMTLLYRNFFIKDLDVSVSAKNICNARKKLPTQREKGNLSAEGTLLEFSASYKW
jgi:outer membrane receptor for ferrienterochelin and colicin